MDQVCNSCGHLNAPGSRFCSSCGKPLEGAVEATTEAIETLDGADLSVDLEAPASGAALVVASGHQARTR